MPLYSKLRAEPPGDHVHIQESESAKFSLDPLSTIQPLPHPSPARALEARLSLHRREEVRLRLAWVVARDGLVVEHEQPCAVAALERSCHGRARDDGSFQRCVTSFQFYSHVFFLEIWCANNDDVATSQLPHKPSRSSTAPPRKPRNAISTPATLQLSTIY